MLCTSRYSVILKRRLLALKFVSSANTPEDSIDPSLRKKRGPQDDKREQETRERRKKAGLKSAREN